MRSSRLRLGVKALRELGPGQVGRYGIYRLLLRSGWLRRATYRSLQSTLAGYESTQKTPLSLKPLLLLPGRDDLVGCLGADGHDRLLHEADEIASGMICLFGGGRRPLDLAPGHDLADWDVYERRGSADGGGDDIKYIWETARFGWAFTLGRAYLCTGDERYAQSFWKNWEAFVLGNPAYLGPNWVSAQEAGLRILAFVFAGQVFGSSVHSTPLRIGELSKSVAVHAARIPPTMLYGRAQNNNHLLSESTALYTAGLALAGHPHAQRWRELGWNSFHAGLERQISPEGVYTQHSTSYHRLMLQLALWVHGLAVGEGRSFPKISINRLKAATEWLLALLDRASGQVPNLGPQDGAYILPLTGQPQADYRPVLESAAAAFWGEKISPEPDWDEMAGWFRVDRNVRVSAQLLEKKPSGREPLTLGPLVADGPWAYLRAARFSGRPGHADQLHLDLWWRGMNITQDPGTYLYNAPAPWENALARSGVHNTLTINGQEQMTWAGRFLWLDRAQARVTERSDASDGSRVQATAVHDGYRRLGLSHQRTVILFRKGRVFVLDLVHPLPGRSQLAAGKNSRVSIEWHWLFPDWEWSLDESSETRIAMILESPQGPIQIRVQLPEEEHGTARTAVSSPLSARLVRAGRLVWGEGQPEPTRGWTSPTYGEKIPALSLVIASEGIPPLSLGTDFNFPVSCPE